LSPSLEAHETITASSTTSYAVQVRCFAFLARIPDLRTDYEGADYDEPQWKRVYKQEEIHNLDEAAFRAWVETLPCCTLGGDRKTPGDPLDVVFVGEGPILALALARQGWHVTEAITPASVWRTISSSLLATLIVTVQSRRYIFSAAIRILPSRKLAMMSTCAITCAYGVPP
jgi:hypothetical protein